MEKKGQTTTRSNADASRTSFRLNRSVIEKLNHIALVERKKRDEFLEELLNKAIEEWERQNGKVKL